MNRNNGPKSSWSWLILPGVLTLVLDQAIKIVTASELRPNQAVAILEQSWLLWTRSPNSGLLFQTFDMLYKPENALWTRYIPTAALILLAFYFMRITRSFDRSAEIRLVKVGFSVFWFGGLSNVLSHYKSVFVDDTVSAKLFPGGRFYTFNVADLGISLGMCLVLVAILWLVVRPTLTRQAGRLG